MRAKPFVPRLRVKHISRARQLRRACSFPPPKGPRVCIVNCTPLPSSFLCFSIRYNSVLYGINALCPSASFCMSCCCFFYCTWHTALLCRQKKFLFLLHHLNVFKPHVRYVTLRHNKRPFIKLKGLSKIKKRRCFHFRFFRTAVSKPPCRVQDGG